MTVYVNIGLTRNDIDGLWLRDIPCTGRFWVGGVDKLVRRECRGCSWADQDPKLLLSQLRHSALPYHACKPYITTVLKGHLPLTRSTDEKRHVRQGRLHRGPGLDQGHPHLGQERHGSHP